MKRFFGILLIFSGLLTAGQADSSALLYCIKKPTSYIALLWPQAYAQGLEKEYLVRQLFKKYGAIKYEKIIYVSSDVALNFIRYIYKHEKWFSTPKGAYEKRTFCCGNHTALKVYLITCDNFEKLLECKYAIRKVFNMGYNSIHITDNHAQSIDLARIVFS